MKDIYKSYKKELLEHIKIGEELFENFDNFEKISKLCINSLKNGGKILFCGNGGSASDSQHLASELIGRFMKNRAPLAAIALTTDTSAITAISNDLGYENIFSRQIKALGKENDCLIAISTSGNSENILNAVRQAKIQGIKTIAFTGNDGGSLFSLCDLGFIIPSNSTARIQEFHIWLGHMLCSVIENEIFKE